MINQCEIVQDLLPLYVDNACSASSTAMVKEHLESCPECKALYETLCSDTEEEILKAEMVDVVAKHEKQIKKKRILTITKAVAITSIVAILVICLLVWRVLPNSLTNIIPVEKDELTSFSSVARISRIENGQTLTDQYSINKVEFPCDEPGKILEILATSSYQQDFRNLLPWKADVVEADKSYDGRSALLVFSVGNQKDEWVEINYLSSGIIVIFTGWEEGYQIYHPTNDKTFDDLMEYFTTHGEKG